MSESKQDLISALRSAAQVFGYQYSEIVEEEGAGATDWEMCLTKSEIGSLLALKEAIGILKGIPYEKVKGWLEDGTLPDFRTLGVNLSGYKVDTVDIATMFVEKRVNEERSLAETVHAAAMSIYGGVPTNTGSRKVADVFYREEAYKVCKIAEFIVARGLQ